LMLGLMLCTMFWSMWLSATVCTAMMVPIALVLVEELAKVSIENFMHYVKS